jgi:hypothetical protein
MLTGTPITVAASADRDREELDRRVHRSIFEVPRSRCRLVVRGGRRSRTSATDAAVWRTLHRPTPGRGSVRA